MAGVMPAENSYLQRTLAMLHYYHYVSLFKPHKRTKLLTPSQTQAYNCWEERLL